MVSQPQMLGGDQHSEAQIQDKMPQMWDHGVYEMQSGGPPWKIMRLGT